MLTVYRVVIISVSLHSDAILVAFIVYTCIIMF